VSIHTQRLELTKLAQEQGYTIVREYVDSQESGKDKDRPGFISMWRDLELSKWDALFLLDTSRLTRDRELYLASYLERIAEKNRVKIIYKNIPAGLDEASTVLLKGVYRAMDAAHSLISKEKALAGMIYNIKGGWRAGEPHLDTN